MNGTRDETSAGSDSRRLKGTGRCYCGKIAYAISADTLFRAQCHCRECQFFTGGHPQVALGVPRDGFAYTRGQPTSYTRTGIAAPVTREFCDRCGVHLAARSPALPDRVLVRPGTLDDPSLFGHPEIAVYTDERQVFHHVPSGIPVFQRLPEEASSDESSSEESF